MSREWKRLHLSAGLHWWKRIDRWKVIGKTFRIMPPEGVSGAHFYCYGARDHHMGLRLQCMNTEGDKFEMSAAEVRRAAKEGLLTLHSAGVFVSIAGLSVFATAGVSKPNSAVGGDSITTAVGTAVASAERQEV